MADWNTIGAVAFTIFVLIFCIAKRKRFKVEGKFPFFYFLLYRTQIGISLMDKIAKRWPRFWGFFGWVSIVVGFFMMAVLLLSIFMLAYNTIFVPSAVPVEGFGLVLPFNIKGAIYIPFSYWIITLAIILIVHEFAHGVMARKYGMRVKYSGFAFFGLLLPFVPGAFVDPDEKQVKKAPPKQQMAMFAAGPVINILIGLLLIFPVLYLFPHFNQLWDHNGLNVISIKEGALPGIQVGDRIIGAAYLEGDNFIAKDISTANDFNTALLGKKAGDKILIKTELKGIRTEHFVTLQDEDLNGKPDLGVSVTESKIIREDLIKRYGWFLPNLGAWSYTLLAWLFILSLGIGIMNLAPIGPLDGGRMALALFYQIFKKKKHAHVAWICLTLIILVVFVTAFIMSL